MGFGVSAPYIRVELTNEEEKKSFKQICFDQEALEFVYRRHATPGDPFHGCQIKLIECIPETSSELVV